MTHASVTPSSPARSPPGGASSLSLAWGGADSTKNSQTRAPRSLPTGGASSMSQAWGDAESSAPVAHSSTGWQSQSCNRKQSDFRSGADHFERQSDRTLQMDPAGNGCVSPEFQRHRDVEPRTKDAGFAADSSECDTFGRYHRESSNAYASGKQQNCGNVITSTPSTRVNAPPGGRSSICLGSDNTEPEFDRNAMKFSKARVPRKQQEHENWFRHDNHPVPSCQSPAVGSDQSTPSQREKPEVEGSRPKKWKPALMPRAPPGGAECYTERAPDARFDGKKLYPDTGAGKNRDMHAMETLRFYQDSEQRLGKQHAGTEQRPRAEKQVCDSFRYHLEGSGQADRTPGKARGEHCNTPYEKPFAAWEVEAAAAGTRVSKRPTVSSHSYSTCADSSEALMQQRTQQRTPVYSKKEFAEEPYFKDRSRCGPSPGSRFGTEDEIPLGADWSTYS